MKKVKLFKNGQSQAVRLPKEMRFEGEEVYAKKVEGGVLLMSSKDPWISFKKGLSMFTDDFMVERNQPDNENERESF